MLQLYFESDGRPDAHSVDAVLNVTVTVTMLTILYLSIHHLQFTINWACTRVGIDQSVWQSTMNLKCVQYVRDFRFSLSQLGLVEGIPPVKNKLDISHIKRSSLCFSVCACCRSQKVVRMQKDLKFWNVFVKFESYRPKQGDLKMCNNNF